MFLLALVEDADDLVVVHVGLRVVAVLVELDCHLGIQDSQVDVALRCVGEVVDRKHELLRKLIVAFLALRDGGNVELFDHIRLHLKQDLLVVFVILVVRVPGHDLDQARDDAVDVNVISDTSLRELDGKRNVLADSDRPQLQEILKVKIEPAPDEWDRLFNVDFFIKINEKYIGLQIKPVSQVSSIPEIYKERGIQHKSHIEFTKQYGGKVFYLSYGL